MNPFNTVSFVFAETIGCLHKNSGSFYLRCAPNWHINIQGATLGINDNNQCWRECCQSRQDCQVPAPTLHIQHLKDKCNNKRLCQVQVQQVHCRHTGHKTDYESVRYMCITTDPSNLPVEHTYGKWIYFEKLIKCQSRLQCLTIKVLIRGI